MAWPASRSTSARISARRASVSGRLSPAARSAVQRPRRTSGAPLVTTAMPPRSASACESAHQLPLGAERHLADALEACLPRVGEPLDLGLRDEECGLGRVALDRPLAVLLAEHGVVREAPSQEHGADLVEQGGVVERSPVDPELALGPVARSGHLHLAGGRHHPLDRHLVLRQRPGLVRAHDRGRPQSLDRRQPLHDRPLPRHALHAECEDDREDRGQPLRHGGDRQGDPDQQHRDEVGGVVDVRRWPGWSRPRPRR